MSNYIDIKIKEAHNNLVLGKTGEIYLTSCERGKFIVMFHYCMS